MKETKTKTTESSLKILLFFKASSPRTASWRIEWKKNNNFMILYSVFEEKLMRPLITFVLLRSENKRHLIDVFSTKIAIRNQ